MTSAYQQVKKRVKNTAISGLAIVALTCSSCATVVNGLSQDIPISSHPPGAVVSVDGEQYGRTPLRVNLKRNKSHSVSASLEGYRTEHARIKPSLSGWVFGNVLLGGLIGFGVDLISGGAFKLNPEQVNIPLAEDSRYTSSRRVETNYAPQKPKVEEVSREVSGAGNVVIRERLRFLKELKEKGDITEDQYNKRRVELIDGFFTR